MAFNIKILLSAILDKINNKALLERKLEQANGLMEELFPS